MRAGIGLVLLYNIGDLTDEQFGELYRLYMGQNQ